MQMLWSRSLFAATPPSVVERLETRRLLSTAVATEQPVYRLYCLATQDHLLTSDVNEYNTLATRGWTQEGIAFRDYNGPATLDLFPPGSGGITPDFAIAVNDEPLYRLYDPADKQHLWTTDLNEYDTLAGAGWTQEGVAGYVFPAAVGAADVPLYRLNLTSPPRHLWTTDQNEYNTLAQDSWTQEGIIGYVL